MENTALQGLDLTGNPELFHLSAWGSKIKLGSLDIRANPNLRSAVIFGTKKLSESYGYAQYGSIGGACVIVNGKWHSIPDFKVATLDSVTFPNPDFLAYLRSTDSKGLKMFDWDGDDVLTNRECEAVVRISSR